MSTDVANVPEAPVWARSSMVERLLCKEEAACSNVAILDGF